MTPAAGTALLADNPLGTVTQACYIADRDVYLMEQKSTLVVPNWDYSCANLRGYNYRIKYDM
jgi:predicted FMN-binding regulatory protein PaiB